MVRPESVILHRQKPDQGSNVVEGKVSTAMFLGEYVDCTVEIGRVVLQTHQPHSFQVRRGEDIWIELPPSECLALPEER
jgi:ABC-type Fe3+/spermidine/putrescine transport system ATPase subunit